MHILDPLIQRVRALKLADFAEHEEDDEYQTHNGHIHQDFNVSPLKLLVIIIHQFDHFSLHKKNGSFPTEFQQNCVDFIS